MLLLLGCVPLPYILPPSDFSVQIDPVPVVREFRGVDVPAGPTAIDLRAGIVPLSVVESMADRKFDPSIGFLATFRHPGADTTIDLGGYGRLAYRAWFDGLGGSTFVTAEPRVTLDVVSEGVDDRIDFVAMGLSVGVALRLGGRCDAGPDGFCIAGGWNSIGVGWGEWGFALAVDGGFQSRQNGTDGRILLGLEIRAPAGVGIVLVPIR